jgi:YegS/Rv2252/BmrU family lipid kinase
VTTGALKPAFRRQRPGRRAPLVPRPGSFSFPSGHSASAFAFATATSWQLPGLAPLLLPLAGAVAWSRVRTGVHHRADVLAGGAVGAAVGLAVTTGPHLQHWIPQLGAIPARPPGFAEAVLVTSPRVAGSRDFAAARREMRRRGLAITTELDVGMAASLRELLETGDPVLVIAAGGDGTVGTVADHLAGTGHVLGVLPLGTSNDFARSLGIPVDPRRAVVLLTRGKVATIDLGRFVPVNKPARHFVHAATVGLNARFARIATRGDVRDRLGRFAYLLAAAYAMRRRPAFGCELRYAGTAEKARLTQLSVINAPVFGGPLQLSVAACNPDDRLLDMLAIEDITPGRMLASGIALLLRARRPVPGIRVWHAPCLHVDADEELEVTLDGEICGTLPGDFEVAGNALRIITPLDFTDIDD